MGIVGGGGGAKGLGATQEQSERVDVKVCVVSVEDVQEQTSMYSTDIIVSIYILRLKREKGRT
jgi:hypothetical protein